MSKNKPFSIEVGYCLWTILILLVSVSCKNADRKKSNSLYSENQLIDTMSIDCLEKKVDISLLPVESVDKQSFDEGFILTVKTKDSSFVILNCLFNSSPNLLTQKGYVILDSVLMKNDRYSYRGIDSTSGKYWRRDGNISYIQVKSKDTTRYNMIFDDKNFLSRR
jgi:hypothetical protein